MSSKTVEHIAGYHTADNYTDDLAVQVSAKINETGTSQVSTRLKLKKHKVFKICSELFK